jgi:hypothetical protein
MLQYCNYYNSEPFVLVLGGVANLAGELRPAFNLRYSLGFGE